MLHAWVIEDYTTIIIYTLYTYTSIYDLIYLIYDLPSVKDYTTIITYTLYTYTSIYDLIYLIYDLSSVKDYTTIIIYTLFTYMHADQSIYDLIYDLPSAKLPTTVASSAASSVILQFCAHNSTRL